MRIHVQNGWYNQYQRQQYVEVEPTDTIRFLKATVQSLLSIGNDEFGQRLLVLLSDDGCRDLQEEDDDRTLLSLGLFRSTGGTPHRLICLKKKSRKFKKSRKIEEEEDDPLPSQQVVIEVPSIQWRFPLLFNPTDTVGTLREGIRNACYLVYMDPAGSPVITEGLFVLGFGRVLLEDESITLGEYGVKHLDSLHLFEEASFPISISISLAGEPPQSRRVEVKCFYTVGLLKGMLQGVTGVPPDRQRLTYQEWALDDNERRLVDYGLTGWPSWDACNRDFVIRLVDSSDDPEPGRCGAGRKPLSLMIAVEIPNMPWRFPLTGKPTDTIATLREDIRGKYYNQYDELLGQMYIENGQFVLAFDGKQLDDSITVDECGIKHMDSIQLLDKASFPIVVSVYKPHLRILVDVKCFDPIRTLKEKIQFMTGIPLEKLRLGSVYWLLDNTERRFVDYGIAKEVEYEKSRVYKISKNDSRNDCKFYGSVEASSSRSDLMSIWRCRLLHPLEVPTLLTQVAIYYVRGELKSFCTDYTKVHSDEVS